MQFGEILDAVEKAGYQAGYQACYQAGYQVGYQAGYQAGKQRTLILISCMIRDGKAEQIPQLSQNPGFKEEMLRAYHLSPGSEAM